MTRPSDWPATAERLKAALSIPDDYWASPTGRILDPFKRVHRDDLRTTLSYIAELEAALERKDWALQAARAKFAFYAESHRNKGTPDGAAKALVNDEMEALCAAALQKGADHGG